MATRIYFDHSATTPIDPRVRDVMLPYLNELYGNPSSLHHEGRKARAAIDAARAQVAGLFHTEPDEVIFTASGTEADNMALIGVLQAVGMNGSHLITSAIEHPAILETCHFLEQQGVEITLLPVSPEGTVSPQSLAQALRPNTRLVSIMAANNVVGTLQPIPALAQITHQHGASFHTDAVQAAGKIPLNLNELPVDLLSLSAHKLYGPKGIGALYIRKGVKLAPLMHGGGQERNLRSATENVAGIVGLGKAAALAADEMAEEAVRLVNLRDQIIDGVSSRLPFAYLLGHRYQRLPGHICLGLSGLEGQTVKLLLALDEAGMAVSAGSACSAHHAGEPSHILMAMGLDPVQARGSLRITLGRFNTSAEADCFINFFSNLVDSIADPSSTGHSHPTLVSVRES